MAVGIIPTAIVGYFVIIIIFTVRNMFEIDPLCQHSDTHTHTNTHTHIQTHTHTHKHTHTHTHTHTHRHTHFCTCCACSHYCTQHNPTHTHQHTIHLHADAVHAARTWPTVQVYSERTLSKESPSLRAQLQPALVSDPVFTPSQAGGREEGERDVTGECPTIKTLAISGRASQV